jgi:ADP-heptose:LPS heptosyltransferase
MPSVRFLARRFADRAFGTAFDRALARARGDARKGFLFLWNRGLGDIALGLVPLFTRIRREIPAVRIEVVTREELRAPFEMTGVDALHIVANLEREARIDIARAAPSLGLDPGGYAAIFDYPDPNRWLVGRRQDDPPRLAWIPAWDALAARFDPLPRGGRLIGAHVNSETVGYYGYVKDWPHASWQALFARFADDRWVLFGNHPGERFEGNHILDLRGLTTFPELMSLIRNRCEALVAPDSGVLTMAYYLDADFALDVVSLWADPRQGILLQGCPSPNPRLRHTAVQSPGEDIRRLPVDDVARALGVGPRGGV